MALPDHLLLGAVLPGGPPLQGAPDIRIEIRMARRNSSRMPTGRIRLEGTTSSRRHGVGHSTGS